MKNVFLLALALATPALALAGDAKPGKQRRAAAPPALTETEFRSLFERLHVKNQPWAAAPWQVSVTAARQKAAREGKPVFLVVNTGNCLGFV
jgi:hypothetical protein